MSSGLFKYVSAKCVKVHIFHIYTPKGFGKSNYIYLIYKRKEDLALDNLQKLICHKPNQSKSYIFNIYV